MSGNVERYIKSAFVVFGPSRIKEIVSYFSTVQEHVEMTEPGNIGYGTFKLFVDSKLFSELRQAVCPRFLISNGIFYQRSMDTCRNNLLFPVFF